MTIYVSAHGIIVYDLTSLNRYGSVASLGGYGHALQLLHPYPVVNM